jgi:hypothetical protein
LGKRSSSASCDITGLMPSPDYSLGLSGIAQAIGKA